MIPFSVPLRAHCHHFSFLSSCLQIISSWLCLSCMFTKMLNTFSGSFTNFPFFFFFWSCPDVSRVEESSHADNDQGAWWSWRPEFEDGEGQSISGTSSSAASSNNINNLIAGLQLSTVWTKGPAAPNIGTFYTSEGLRCCCPNKKKKKSISKDKVKLKSLNLHLNPNNCLHTHSPPCCDGATLTYCDAR